MSHLAADKYLYSVNKGGKVIIAASGKDSFNLFDIKAASGAAAKYNWQTYRGKDSADGTLSEDDIISVNKVTGEVTGRAVGTSYVIANEPGDATMTAVYKVEVKPAAAVAFFGIPKELEESAVIDGCTEVGVLFKIMLPVSLPGVLTIALFYSVDHWNDFFNAIMYLNDRFKWPLQLFLRSMLF